MSLLIKNTSRLARIGFQQTRAASSKITFVSPPNKNNLVKFSFVNSNNNNRKYFSTKLSKLNIDPITAIVLEAEKYAPKNVKQIEERIYEIEEDLQYNENNIGESRLCEIYEELSDLYCKIYRYEKAENILLKYIELYSKLYGNSSIPLGNAYHKLSEINVAVDKLKLAYQYQSKCIGIKTTSFLENKSVELTFDLSSEWNFLGEIAMKQGNLTDAKKTFQKSVKLFEQTLGPIYEKDEREIRNDYEKSKNISKSFMEVKDVPIKESSDYIKYKSSVPKSNIRDLEFVPIDLLKSLDNLGTVQYRLKEYEEAYFTFGRAVQYQYCFDKIAQSDNVMSQEAFEIIGNVYLNMANCALYLEMPEKAEDLYQKAIVFIQKVLGDKHPKIGSLLYSLGVLYASKGDYKHSEEFTKKALEVFSMTDSEMDLPHSEQIRKLLETGKCYLTLGTLYLNRKDFSSAEDMLKRSLDIHNNMKSAGSQDSNTTFDIAFILNSLGKISEEKNLPEEALAYYQKAYIIAKSIKEGNNHVVATALMNIGKFFYNQENFEEAEKHYIASYKAYDASFPTQYHPDVGDLCMELGKTYMKLNMNENAKRKFEEARDVYLGYELPTSNKLDKIFDWIKVATGLVNEDLDRRSNDTNLSPKEKEKLNQDIDFEKHRDKDNHVREQIVTLKRKQLNTTQQ